MAKGEGKVVAQNKKAHHDYTIVDTLEAGMVLTGTEIKSVRAARINLKDGFAQVKNGEVWLFWLSKYRVRDSKTKPNAITNLTK